MIRVIRDIDLKNVKLISRGGNCKFNILDPKDGTVKLTAGVISHDITAFSSVFVVGNKDKSETILNTFQPNMSIQFVEDYGIYKIFFNRKDLVNDEKRRYVPYGEELGIWLGKNPEIEDNICKILDNLNRDGVVIYSYPSIEIGVKDWIKPNSPDEHTMFQLNRFTGEQGYSSYVALQSGGVSPEQIWVKFTNDDTVNILSDNKFIINDIPKIIEDLNTVPCEEYSDHLKQFTSLNVREFLDYDMSNYFAILEDRINKKIKSTEEELKKCRKIVTLEDYLRLGLSNYKKTSETNKLLWVLNNMKYAIRDSRLIEGISSQILRLLTNYTIDNCYCSILYNSPFQMPRHLINIGAIVPILDDIDIDNTIDMAMEEHEFIEYSDDWNDNILVNYEFIGSTLRYLSYLMVGIKMNFIRLALDNAKFLRDKYNNMSYDLDMKTLTEMINDNPQLNVTSATTEFNVKVDRVKRNLKTIDLIISLLTELVNKNNDKDVISLGYIAYNKNICAWERLACILPCIDFLTIGVVDQMQMCKIFETYNIGSTYGSMFKVSIA